MKLHLFLQTKHLPLMLGSPRLSALPLQSGLLVTHMEPDPIPFSICPGDVGGEVLVDIGSGPTLYQVLSGCEVFSKVILTDYMEVNRQELNLWLQGGSEMDWAPFLQHVCKLEGRR